MRGKPMLRGRTEAETCKLNGFVVGDHLVGDEGYGPTVIRITAIGEETLLAKTVSHDGKPPKYEREGTWTLSCREWAKAGKPRLARAQDMGDEG